MRYSYDDEQAYNTRRDELGEQFAAWLNTHQVPGDPNDAGLLMDWKVGYGDGALDVWTVADVEEFRFGWCLRKLSAAPADAEEVPMSLAAFVEFLAHTGRLAKGSATPAAVRRYCETHTDRFVREMANAANFGMAKSLFGGGALSMPAGLGELLGGTTPAELAALMEQFQEGPPAIGPVRLPGELERRESLRDATALQQVRKLAAYCAKPGRALTGTGNLRIADARELVVLLGTGDDPDLGGRQKLTSAADLPGLDPLFRLAVQAGAVRRVKGKLLAVATFAALDDIQAFTKMVRAAVEVGSPHPMAGGWFSELFAALDECVPGLLSDLLIAGPTGRTHNEIVEAMVTYLQLTRGAGHLGELLAVRIPGVLERFIDLGVITADDERATLTAAGMWAVAEMMEQAGVEVLRRSDPRDADAAELIDLIEMIDEDEWRADVAAWISAQPGADAAIDELVAQVCAENRGLSDAMLGISAIAAAVGDDAIIPAVRRQLNGPRDGIVVSWLSERGAIDPATIEPIRHVSGIVDVLGVAVDMGGPNEAVAVFAEADQARQLELLEAVWRIDHPRLPEILEILGRSHPTKVVAKAARKALVKHRSLLASTPSR